MEILFCDECGMRFSSEVPPTTAQPGGEQKKLCDACRAKLRATKPSNRQLQPAARARSERSIPVAQHAAGTHRPATHPTDTTRHRGGQLSSKTPVMVGAIVVLVLLAVGGLFLKPAVPEPAATATGPTPTARATPPVTSNPAPPKTQEPARQAPPDSTPATSAGQAKSTAQAADEAFTKLQYFEGLAPDDRDGRIRQIEEFLAKYGQEIVASRARVMLSELNAPPPTPEPARIQTTTPPPAEPAPPPSTEGWKAVSGPFTFEDGQVNRWDGDLGSRVEAGEFEGRKCLRLRPGDQRNCRAFRGPSMDSAGVRVRFRYFAHDVEYVEVLWAQGSHRPRKHIEPLVRDGWAEVCFTGVELGGNATRLGHIEIGGPAKSGESFLLLDDVVWEKQ